MNSWIFMILIFDPFKKRNLFKGVKINYTSKKNFFVLEVGSCDIGMQVDVIIWYCHFLTIKLQKNFTI